MTISTNAGTSWVQYFIHQSQCLIVNLFFSFLVGYIVGLGDRHVQNILVDCNTAELVHIDLGEEGRTAKPL